MSLLLSFVRSAGDVSIEAAYAQRAVPFVAGRRYGPDVNTLAGVALAADTLYAVPVWTGAGGIYATELAINVSTGSAGNARLGIYQSLTTAPFLPGSLLLDAGTISTSSTGRQAIDITDARYTGAAPSYYIWLAIVCNATPSVYADQNTGSILGLDSNGLPLNAVRMSHVYAALPSTFSASPTSHPAAPLLHLTAG